MVTKTVRRGTKLFNKAVDNFKKVIIYILDDGLKGREFDTSENGWTPRKELEVCKNSFLVTEDGVNFTLHIHDSLRFEWAI